MQHLQEITLTIRKKKFALREKLLYWCMVWGASSWEHKEIRKKKCLCFRKICIMRKKNDVWYKVLIVVEKTTL